MVRCAELTGNLDSQRLTRGTVSIVIELRPVRLDDVEFLERWDEDPDVAASGGDDDWWDWPLELSRGELPWREMLIAEEDGRRVGFVQLIDAAEEESHYWGDDVPAGAWAIDIWIGTAGDRGRGLGTEMMRLALARCFDGHGASEVLIDPLASNGRAIRFYERLGFEFVEERDFGGDHCLVHRYTRP
jgi:aminoglycoside 6'-N-acetyltransferase